MLLLLGKLEASFFFGTPKYLETIAKVHEGMPQTQVVDILGQPSTKLGGAGGASGAEAWYFRFRGLADASGEKASTEPEAIQALMGRIRCVFVDGKLVKIDGFWPASSKPPSGTPKNKVLLVDVVKVHDDIASTDTMTKRYKALMVDLLKELDKITAEAKALNEEAHKVQKQLAKLSDHDIRREALQKSLSEVQGRAKAKEAEEKRFTAEKRNGLINGIERYLDVVMPAISEAILRYKEDHGYLYVYELSQNVFSPGMKPLFVSGEDKTDDIIAWINAGGAKSLGL